MTNDNVDIADNVTGDTRDPFYEYYAEESLSRATAERFQSIHSTVGHILRSADWHGTPLDVADVGCGAGAQSMLWARDGHRTYGIDINTRLIELARRRASEAGFTMTFDEGSATNLPWADASMDVCLVPELLEHVADWRSCLDEFARILRPGGVLFLSTNNSLCPVQQEFELPLYSWYPGFMKRRYERLAVTTRPELVNHAEYPAVNWFTYYGLRREMDARGFDSRDRFDAMDLSRRGTVSRLLVQLVRLLPPLRLAAHIATPYTAVIATRRKSAV